MKKKGFVWTVLRSKRSLQKQEKLRWSGWDIKAANLVNGEEIQSVVMWLQKGSEYWLPSVLGKDIWGCSYIFTGVLESFQFDGISEGFQSKPLLQPLTVPKSVASPWWPPQQSRQAAARWPQSCFFSGLNKSSSSSSPHRSRTPAPDQISGPPWTHSCLAFLSCTSGKGSKTLCNASASWTSQSLNTCIQESIFLLLVFLTHCRIFTIHFMMATAKPTFGYVIVSLVVSEWQLHLCVILGCPMQHLYKEVIPDIPHCIPPYCSFREIFYWVESRASCRHKKQTWYHWLKIYLLCSLLDCTLYSTCMCWYMLAHTQRKKDSVLWQGLLNAIIRQTCDAPKDFLFCCLNKSQPQSQRTSQK